MTRPLTYDDYDRLRIIYEWDNASVRLSPTGKHVAYLVRSGEMDESDEFRKVELFVADTETGESTSVRAEGRSSNPSWSQDGRALAFLNTQGDDSTLWVWETESREARQVSTERCFVGGRGGGPTWDPEGKKIYLSLPRAGSAKSDEPVREEKAAEGFSNVQVFRSPELPDDISLPGLDRVVTSPELGVVDLVTGETQRLLDGLDLGSFRLSPDGNWLAVAGANKLPDRSEWKVFHDLLVSPASGGEPRRIEENVESRGLMARAAYAWSPDSRVLAYIAEKKVWIFDPSTGESRSIDNEFEHAPHVLLWSPDGKVLLSFESGGSSPFVVSPGLIATAEDGSSARRLVPPEGRMTSGQLRDVIVLGDSSTGLFWSDGDFCAIQCTDQLTKDAEIWELPLDGGSPSLLWKTDRWISHMQPPAENRIVLCLQDETTPGDLWAGQSYEQLRQITDLNPELEETARGRGRVISWRDTDGTEMFGYVLLPPDFEEGRPVPTVADIYPGIKGSDSGRRWNTGAGVIPPQMLVGRGYAVLIPDLPGVMPAMPRPSGLFPTVNGAISELIRLGIADPDRLGVMGQSGGGGAVNLVITETSIFKAAVSVAGAANWSSFFGQFRVLPDGSFMTYGAGLPSMAYGGPPWEKKMEYLQTSPVFRLGSVTTPLLLIHGTYDVQVGVEQSGEMFAGLMSQKKKVVFCRYPGEGHVPASFGYANRQDVTDRVLSWFEEHL